MPPESPESKSSLDAAREYVARGLSVLPIKPDGTKAPALKRGEPEVYRDQRYPTDEELVRWLGTGRDGVAVAGGKLSGNLAVLDFEAPEVWEKWRAAVPADTTDF